MISYVYGNLGLLDTRTGSLVDAEMEFRQGIALAERIDDPASTSILLAALANVLQEKGKLSEAATVLQRALMIGRAIHIVPCISLALVSLGCLRIFQALAMSINEDNRLIQYEESAKLLNRAKKTLTHALALGGMEAETRNEGQLALAQVALLLGDLDRCTGAGESSIRRST